MYLGKLVSEVYEDCFLLIGESSMYNFTKQHIILTPNHACEDIKMMWLK